MICAIKDTHTNEYLSARTTDYGWYHPDIGRARFFTNPKYAQRTIDTGINHVNHHVTWLNNRVLVIVGVEMKVIKTP